MELWLYYFDLVELLPTNKGGFVVLAIYSKRTGRVIGFTHGLKVLK
jgi:hypothetical protein